MLVGPNTGLGHNSIVFMIESQVAYVMDALRTIDAHGAVRVRRARRRRRRPTTTSCSGRCAGTVWTQGGCASWYLDAHGRNTTLWPGTLVDVPPRTRRFDAAEYELLAPGAAPPGARRRLLS